MLKNLECRAGYNLLYRRLSNFLASERSQKEWLTTQEDNVLSGNSATFADGWGRGVQQQKCHTVSSDPLVVPALPLPRRGTPHKSFSCWMSFTTL